MAETSKRATVEKAIAGGNGILRLKPAWVARDFLPLFGPDINLDVPMIPRYGNWPGPGK